MTHRSIESSELTRVEGQGALEIEVDGGGMTRVELRIYEPPRFFEQILRGCRYDEPPDITARICGICPVAYQMSSCQAIERALGVVVDGPLRDLRRLLYVGEWVQSHALHVYLLHAPDFLGYPSSFAMAADHREWVERGLRIKRAGNTVIDVVGGRAVHPVNVRVGGFHSLPDRARLDELAERMEQGRVDALATVEWVAGFAAPAVERDYTFLALRHPEEYAMLDGRLASSAGLDAGVDEFEHHVAEHAVGHSTARHARLDGEVYLTGPLARYAINHDRLRPVAARAAADAGLGMVCRNPYRSIVVRAVELVHAFDEALALLAAYREPAEPFVPCEPRAGAGSGASEAPRGVLYHRYVLDDGGRIAEARIVPPTAQNQAQIEADLAALVAPRLAMDDATLADWCERLVRSHDPCISCATHFLSVKVKGRAR